MIPNWYEVWPHTRQDLGIRRGLAITEAEHQRLDEAERAFDAEDKARWASWRTINAASQSARRATGGEEEPT